MEYAQITREEANRLLGLLSTQDDRDDDWIWAAREHDLHDALATGSLDDQVHALHALYRARSRPSMSQRRLIQLLEDTVVAQIAEALGLSKEALVAELESRHPTFAVGATPPRPEPALARPEPSTDVVWPEHDFLGSFRVEAAIAIGEHPCCEEEITGAERPNYLALAEGGTWYAFVRGDEDVDALVIVHADHARRFEDLAREARHVCDLDVDGDRMAMVDAAVVHDVRFTSELEAPLFPEGLVLDRGCQCRADDGRRALHTVEVDGKMIYARVTVA